MSRSRDVERFAVEHGLEPGKVSAREARAYSAQITWNRMMQRLATNGHGELPRPINYAAEIAAGRGQFVTPNPKGSDAPVQVNTWANEIWRLWKHPPNLYAKFRQAIEK